MHHISKRSKRTRNGYRSARSLALLCLTRCSSALLVVARMAQYGQKERQKTGCYPSHAPLAQRHSLDSLSLVSFGRTKLVHALQSYPELLYTLSEHLVVLQKEASSERCSFLKANSLTSDIYLHTTLDASARAFEGHSHAFFVPSI